MAVTFYFVRHGETIYNVINKVQGWCDTPLTSKGVYAAYMIGCGLADVDFVGACTSDSGRAQDTLSIALEARENERMRRVRGLPRWDEAQILENISHLRDIEALADLKSINLVENLLRANGALRPGSAQVGEDVPTEAAAKRISAAERWEPRINELEWIDYPAYALSARIHEPRMEPPVPVRRDDRLREWCFGDLEERSGTFLHERLIRHFGHDMSREEENERLDEIADALACADPTKRTERFAAITERLRSFLDDCGSSVEKQGGGNVLVISHSMVVRTLVFLFGSDRKDAPAKIENASLTEVIWDHGNVALGKIGDTEYLKRLA